MRSSRLLEDILRCIEVYPGSGLDDLAAAMHYSKYHLHHLFSDTAGISPGEYILRRRLTRAARQLTGTGASILDIALSCGYESRQAFTSAFKDAYHCTPDRFRRSRRFYPLQPVTEAGVLVFVRKMTAMTRKESGEMNSQGSMTALMSAFGRAWHCANEATPVFADDRARALFSNEEYAFMRGCILNGRDFFAPGLSGSDEEVLRAIVNESIAPTPLCRAAYCEAALETAERTGTVQYVILGAGLDTFAFRNAGFVGRHPVYEVDHPSTQADKLRRIDRAGWRVPENLHFVGTDFAKDSLAEKLLAAGFDPTKKTLFSWLGVSYYLARGEIDAFLGQLSALCAEGSSLVFDYADRGLFDAEERRVKNMIALACSSGEPMKSCFSHVELARLLEVHGFLVYEELSPAQIQAELIGQRCPDMTAFEHIHYVLAVRK